MEITTEQFISLLTKDDLKNLRNGLISKDEFNDKCEQVIEKINGIAKEVRDFHAEMASKLLRQSLRSASGGTLTRWGMI